MQAQILPGDNERGQYAVLKVQAGPDHQNHTRVAAVMQDGDLLSSRLS